MSQYESTTAEIVKAARPANYKAYPMGVKFQIQEDAIEIIRTSIKCFRGVFLFSLLMAIGGLHRVL